MKKLYFVVFCLLFVCSIALANPLKDVPGVLLYTEQTQIYFDNEENANRWVETQNDFISLQEATDAYRRIMESSLLNLAPEFSNIVRLRSDFFVMISRSSEQGGSSLMLFVRGELKRLWQY